MRFSRDSQNTILMILTIFIVSLITLIAVVNIAWNAIKSPVQGMVNNISYIFQSQTLDYNFEVVRSSSENLQPEITSQETEQSQEPEQEQTDEPESGYPEYVDEIIMDLNPDTPTDRTTSQIVAHLRIPELDFQSGILRGPNPRVDLTKGLWMHYNSYNFGEGEVLVLCYRQFFSAEDPRSCADLDKLKIGDNFSLKIDDVEMNYEVIGLNLFAKNNTSIYSTSENPELLKLVTSTPLNKNNERLVISARRN